MRLTAMIGAGLLALLGAANAHAIPMNFSVSYDGSTLGGAGTGAFTFDDETNRLTGFTFSFGSFMGAVPDQNLTGTFFGAPVGAFFFEVLTGADQVPAACGITTTCGLNTTTVADLVQFAMFSRMVSNPLAAYEFRDGARTLLFAGRLSVQQVPEPATLALLGLGALGVALARRRAVAAS